MYQHPTLRTRQVLYFVNDNIDYSEFRLGNPAQEGWNWYKGKFVRPLKGSVYEQMEKKKDGEAYVNIQASLERKPSDVYLFQAIKETSYSKGPGRAMRVV